MTIAITGASGFVRRNLVLNRAQSGLDVAPLSGRPMAVPGWRKSPGLDVETDPGEWAPAFSGVTIVVHCAARAHVMDEQAADPLEAFGRINRDGSIAMAKGATMAGVERIVFLSTAKVLGETTSGRLPFLGIVDKGHPQFN